MSELWAVSIHSRVPTAKFWVQKIIRCPTKQKSSNELLTDID